jgi:excisionase family DNA binding protein
MTKLADMPDVLTVEEAAEVLRIGRTAAYEAARRGELPAVRIGRSLRVPRHALDALLQNGDGPAANGAARETSTIARPEGEGVREG